MKGTYFSNYNLDDISSGVSKKISMQLDAFRKNNVDIVAPKVYANSFISKAYIKLPFVSSIHDFKVSTYIRKELIDDHEFVYIRHNVFTRQLYYNLKNLRHKKIKVFYEIPTYPYDRNEFKVKNYFMRAKDKYWSNKVGKYIDYIVDYSGTDKIFGVDTINISNGINPDFIIPKSVFSKNESIHLIAVALMAPVHGFDRVINSLYKYYKNGGERKVYFHVVGNGNARSYLECLVKKLNLEEYICFHGLQHGVQLDELYDQSDIGVGVLGIHRRYANQKVSSLKTKEYSAKGIPFISGEFDDVFERHNCDFKFMVKQTDDSFDMNDVLKWYDALALKYGGKKELAKHIRKYAVNYLTWEEQIVKIIEKIK